MNPLRGVGDIGAGVGSSRRSTPGFWTHEGFRGLIECRTFWCKNWPQKCFVGIPKIPQFSAMEHPTLGIFVTGFRCLENSPDAMPSHGQHLWLETWNLGILDHVKFPSKSTLTNLKKQVFGLVPNACAKSFSSKFKPVNKVRGCRNIAEIGPKWPTLNSSEKWPSDLEAFATLFSRNFSSNRWWNSEFKLWLVSCFDSQIATVESQSQLRGQAEYSARCLCCSVASTAALAGGGSQPSCCYCLHAAQLAQVSFQLFRI